jgi:serine/threonine-protein kinase PRP4
MARNQAVESHKREQGIKLDESMLDNWDDPDGYYRIILGELLDGRYNVQSNLGKGVFSAVVRATDTRKNGELVAIKIIRANDTM